MQITDDQLLNVIAHAPLVSVDLIIYNPAGQLLLGKRTNRPAQGYWFVPGGRIRKNETTEQAIGRIAKAEIGHPLTGQATEFYGVFEHFYEDNAAGVADIGTHYVVLAYRITLDTTLLLMADTQHAALRWWSVYELQKSPHVHEYTKRYTMWDDD